jgi:hypothetical protein
MKMKIDILNKRAIDDYLLDECILYNDQFDLLTRHYSNAMGMAGYILKDNKTNLLYFAENLSIDSWCDGSGFGDVDEINIYEVLSHEPKYDYYEIGKIINTIIVDNGYD